MSVRVIRPGDLRFMVNPVPVTNNGKAKLHRGKPVYLSAVHIERSDRGTTVIAHPNAFEFVVV